MLKWKTPILVVGTIWYFSSSEMVQNSNGPESTLDSQTPVSNLAPEPVIEPVEASQKVAQENVEYPVQDSETTFAESLVSDEQNFKEPQIEEQPAQSQPLLTQVAQANVSQQSDQEVSGPEATGQETNDKETQANSSDELVSAEITPVDPDVEFNYERDGGTRYITVEAGGTDEISLVFRGECWLEIKDADGRKIFGDLGQAGDELSITGLAPFRFLFGDASVVKMSFNGEDYDLQPHITREQTAKFSIGN